MTNDIWKIFLAADVQPLTEDLLDTIVVMVNSEDEPLKIESGFIEKPGATRLD
ncbi:MAG: hypothetical protein ABJC05_08175 [Pyrinomonadaceae bacterium]